MLPGGAGNTSHSIIAEILKYQYGSNTAHSIMAEILQYRYGSRPQYHSKVKEHPAYNRLTWPSLAGSMDRSILSVVISLSPPTHFSSMPSAPVFLAKINQFC